MESEARIQGILRTLERHYPHASLALNFRNPFELLIAVILSAQCTDERVNQVTRTLFERCPTPQALAAEPLESLEQMVRSTGYYRNKAKAVRACAQEVVEKHGGEVPRTMEALVRLPGVGRKTAAMVLGNAYGIQEGVAVDTHVLRVSQRLGIVDEKTPEAVERRLMEMVPRAQWTWFSNAMIQHGRMICTARKPLCSRCPLADDCDYAQQTGRGT
ncbi:endonuclease III [Desulfosoma caldarium]|uniref:Endonuclease III n=1 Tax=Desulfosoma caldarium TaxID=610254 RepID=A0A3N1VPL3_9BACT|nr:endonuclease III [Desulfosoma caldarium]ROR02968.1 DNA-(apurinic or apyrimidinic site) lyase /endonuclease III [Desulfosoma caldarium]